MRQTARGQRPPAPRAAARWQRRRLVLGAIAATLPLGRAASNADALARLAEPHTHAIMRHALAPGYSDPAAFDVDDCTTQRNLDDRGREQARRTGARLREAGVQIDRVLSSRWCRCLDTARLLGLGAVVEVPALNSFFENRADGPAQTASLRTLLDRLPPDETLMMVTHQVNISALLGRGTTSGEVLIFRRRPGEDTVILGGLVVPA
ncbi:MAG: histidine phosphatase family protein [Pseudomonadota bacterium]